jgi:hypothetical protein
MMANATKAGSNLYSLEWSGPPETTYSLGSMVGALGALIASIGPTPLQNQTASAPSSSASAASITHGASVAHLCAVYGSYIFCRAPFGPSRRCDWYCRCRSDSCLPGVGLYYCESLPEAKAGKLKVPGPAGFAFFIGEHGKNGWN